MRRRIRPALLDRRRGGRRAHFAAVLGVALALAACADAPEPSTGGAGPTPAASAGPAPFDPGTSDRFLAEASASAAAGDLAAAEQQYQAAALVWPDNVEAWQGLVAVAEARDDPAAAEAAAFVLRRLYLFPSGALGVQREYRAALLGYVAEAESAPDANPLTLTYARALAAFYAHRYAARGTHQPVEGYFDLRWADVPAAMVSGALLIAYGANLASGISGSSD